MSTLNSLGVAIALLIPQTNGWAHAQVVDVDVEKQASTEVEDAIRLCTGAVEFLGRVATMRDSGQPLSEVIKMVRDNVASSARQVEVIDMVIDIYADPSKTKAAVEVDAWRTCMSGEG